ncbi:MAG: SpoIIE family protein phosphatase [Clostridia bacterium]|nr:SpoIIE family protein phosphatase [Clostridia bacterium]
MKKINFCKKYGFSILKYFLFFVVFFVLSKASIYNLIFPFAFGLFFALIWCNQKIYILAPLYIFACLVSDFSLINCIGVVTNVFIAMILFGLHIKLKKPIKFGLFSFYTIIAQSGFLLAQIYFNNSILIPILTIIIGFCFMLACKEILQVFLQRGLIYKLNIVEIVCGLVVLCAFSDGLCSFNIFGFVVVKLFAVFAIFMSVYVFNISTSILLASVIGLGGLVASGSTIFIAPFVIWALIASSFKTANRFVPVISVLLVEFCLGYYINIYNDYNLIAFAPIALGSLIFLTIPNTVIQKIVDYCHIIDNNMAMKSVVNRSRENLCKRLYDLSDVFGEMDYVFRSMIKGGMTKEQVKNFLIGEVKDKVCADCAEKNMCHRMCIDETCGVFEALIVSALERGKTSLLDVPPYLTTRCSRVSNLVGAINQLCAQYRQYAGVMNNLDASRVLIAEQLSGVSKIMKNLAGEVNKNISFDNNKENVIINELSYNNIICSDAVIYEQNADVVSATIVVRKEDSSKNKITEIVSKVCKNKMIITSDNTSTKAGWNVLTLKTAPKYDVIFGTASCAKDGSKISGDCYSIIRIDNDKFLLALCDGMGSGEKAEKTSSLAIGLVENFYKAGFDNDIVLSSINKLLSLNREEIFSALDVCVVDTRQGTADFIKMGAPNSYIKHINTIDTISGGTLPLGIVQDMQPIIIKKVLNVGDMVFLFTDGITESFASDAELEDYINNMKGLNPQILAEELINISIKINKGAKDDMTIIVAKIFAIA